MDILLRFKKKEVTKAHAQGYKLYVNKTFYYYSVMITMVLLLQLYSVITAYKHNLKAGMKNWGIAFGTQSPIIVAFIILKKVCKNRCSRHEKLVDLLLTMILLGQVTIFLYSALNSLFVAATILKDPNLIATFFNGYYWSSLISLLALIGSNWMPRSFIILGGNCAVYITIYLKLKVPAVVIGGVIVQIIYMLFYYIEEKIEKMSFLAKYKANQQANCLREIMHDVLEGVVIYDHQRKSILFQNKTLTTLPFWKEDTTLEENFKKFIVELVTFNSTEVPIPGENPEACTLTDLFSELIMNPNFIPDSSQTHFKSHYLIHARFAENDQMRRFSIQVIPSTYDNELVWAFIIRDNTDHDMLVTLQDHNQYKNRLLASVSHELRTPLNCSIVFTEQAIDDADTPPFIRESYLKPVLSSCKLLLHVINDILDFSQIQKSKLKFTFEEKNIVTSIRECINLMRIQAQMKGLAFEADLRLPSEGFALKTDHKRVQQILLNLLSNALKFTLKGKILVSAHLNLAVSRNGQDNINTVEVKVQDTGVGMTEEDIRKLQAAFEHKELGDEDLGISKTGIGLGLLISNNLARTLAPTNRRRAIEISSKIAVGSTFSFEIASQDNPETMETANILHDLDSLSDIAVINELDYIHIDEGPKKSLTQYRLTDENNLLLSPTGSQLPSYKFLSILKNESTKPHLLTLNSAPNIETKVCQCPAVLIVDDDIFNIAALGSILKKLAIATESAFNGQNAINKCLERTQNKCCSNCKFFDLIFMDCSMPVMDGYEATKAIKAMMEQGQLDNCPVVACTAFTQPSELEKCKISGMDDYVAKPISNPKLKDKLKKYKLYIP